MLSDVVKEFSCRNKDLRVQKVYSVTNSDGFMPSQDYFSKDVFSKNLSNYKIVRKGMLAYNPSRINVGSVACLQSEDEVIVSPLYVVVEVNEKKLLAEYLNLFLHSDIALEQIKSLTSGSVRDSLKYNAFTRLCLPIPTVEMQRAVIKKLNAIKKLIAKREQQLSKLDQLAKSRFIEMFGAETEFKRWRCITIGEIADVRVGVVIKPTQYYTDDGIPAFRSLNIGKMEVKNTDWIYFTEEGHKKNQKSVIQKNDVLVVRSGAPGTACVATEQYDGYNAVDIIIARPDNDRMNSVFLAAFTNMPHGIMQIRKQTGGAAQQHFNVGSYKAMKIILPPIELQNEFAAFIEQLDKSKVTIRKSIEKLETTYRALLQEYFG